MIRAAAAARAARPDLHWVIAGSGPRRGALQRLINDLDLASRVHLTGYIEEADALIREGNVFVMSSREEGLGSVVLQALALGSAATSVTLRSAAGIVAPRTPSPNRLRRTCRGLPHGRETQAFWSRFG